MSILRPKLSESEILRRHPMMGVLIAAGVTGLCLLTEPWLGHRPALLVYLAALVLAGPMLDRIGVYGMAGGSALAWNFFFTQPRFTLSMNDREDIALLVLFGVLTFAVARLARGARDREVAGRGDAERRRALYDITRELTSGTDPALAVTAALRRLGEAYEADASVILFEKDTDKPVVVLGDKVSADAIASARWTVENRLPVARRIEIPEDGGVQQFVLPVRNNFAVLHLCFRHGRPDDADRAEALRIIAHLLAPVLER